MELERKQGLPPIAKANARLLILGSLPGDASLQAERYYAHPRNQFWPLLERVIGEPLAALPYGDRLVLLQRRGIALWDVIETAHRPGSLDQRLSRVEARDLAGFVASLPQLRAIAFNGGTAARIGRQALAGTTLPLVDLPSSSPAFTRPLAEKAAAWMQLRTYIID